MVETFRALADPSRLRIIELLANGPLPVGSVASGLRIRQPQASKHLGVLSAAGLVEMRPDAQRRIYALRPDPLRGLDLWLARYRDLWEEQFERLDDVLKEMQAGAKQATKRRRARRRK